MIDTVTYGSTVICSSLTKPSAAHFSDGRALAEEQADEHASREAHENAVRK